MQNKKVKHRPLIKYLHFHKITGPTLFFFFLVKNSKKNKKKVSSTYRPFFSILVETQLFLRLMTYTVSADSDQPDHVCHNGYYLEGAKS